MLIHDAQEAGSSFQVAGIPKDALHLRSAGIAGYTKPLPGIRIIESDEKLLLVKSAGSQKTRLRALDHKSR